MKNNGFDDVNNDWLTNEKKRESKISAWDLDDTASNLKREHQQDCEAKEIKDRHERIHSSMNDYQRADSFKQRKGFKADDAFKRLEEVKGGNDFKDSDEFKEIKERLSSMSNYQEFKKINNTSSAVSSLVGGITAYIFISIFMSIFFEVFLSPKFEVIYAPLNIILLITLVIVPIAKNVKKRR